MPRRLALAASLLSLGGCPQSPEDNQGAERLALVEARLAALEGRPEQLDAAGADPIVVPPDSTAPTISITVTPSKLFVRGKPIEGSQLQGRLEALAARMPDANVTVQADATVSHQRVIEIVDTAKEVGLSRIAIATRPVPTDPAVVQLPRKLTGKAGSRIALTITSSQIFVNGEAVASVALRAQLEALAATSPDASVVIQADASVGHGRVVDAMDTVKKAGFSRIAIATLSDE